MSRKYAAVLLASTLIIAPAFAQTRPAPNPPSSPTSTGGGSSGYNQTLTPASAQTTLKPPAAKPTGTRPAPNPAGTLVPNLVSIPAPTGGGSSGYNQTLSKTQ